LLWVLVILKVYDVCLSDVAFSFLTVATT
jgi:hypothetical protein